MNTDIPPHLFTSERYVSGSWQDPSIQDPGRQLSLQVAESGVPRSPVQRTAHLRFGMRKGEPIEELQALGVKPTTSARPLPKSLSRTCSRVVASRITTA